MIPPIVHYCWYGKNPKSEEANRFIASWHKFLPNHHFMEWNESNCDMKSCSFVREAFFLKKYAFVSDYFRMKALYEYGGLYLDTDVEMVRDISPLMERGSFVGLETENLYGTGIMCAEPGAIWVKKMLDRYEHEHFFTWKGMLNTWANSIVLTKMYPHGSLPVTVYPIDFLSAKNWKTGEYQISQNTYTIHHYAASWAPDKTPRQILRLINYIKFAKYGLFRFLGRA